MRHVQFILNLINFLQAKSEEQIAKEKLWLDTEKVWLMHRDGFASGRKQHGNDVDSGKIKLILDQTGDVIIVDEDDIEKVM